MEKQDVNVTQEILKQNRILLERILRWIMLATGCGFNIVWLFIIGMDYNAVMPAWGNMGVKVFSLLWGIIFGLYISLVIWLLKKAEADWSYFIKLGLFSCMTIELYINQWFTCKMLFAIVGIVCLVIISYCSFYVDISESKTTENVMPLDLKRCRDDRRYLPILLKNINSDDLRNRIANEVGTYVYSAYKYKRRFYFFTFISISFPAAIAALNSIGTMDGNTVSITISLLSMATVIVTGLMSTMKARESWVRNREYAERAKYEIFSCVMGISSYNHDKKESDDKEKLLAERLEGLFMEESGQWKKLRGNSEDEKRKDKQ